MQKIIQDFLNFINSLLNKKEVKELPPSQSEKFVNETYSSRALKDVENEIDKDSALKVLQKSYYQKFRKEDIYNYPLYTNLTKEQTLELAKDFFKNLDSDLSEKAIEVIDNKSKNFNFIFEQYGNQTNSDGKPREAEFTNSNEVYCPIRGDLRDLYGIVHEVTHTFDLQNGDTDARQIFGEVAPQCMERLLDSYLLDLDDETLENYDINKDTLEQDIRRRQTYTFLSRYNNIKAFNNKKGNSIKNLRYSLAQLYSSAFTKSDSEKQINELKDFIQNVSNNNIEKCCNSFDFDFRNQLRTQFAVDRITKSIKEMNTQTLLNEKLDEILEKSKDNKDFTTKFDSQNIYVSLESKIPFVLITPITSYGKKTIVMESNNLETNNKQDLLTQALKTGKNLNDIFNKDAPIFIPILPSPSKDAPYYQQLSTDCFKNAQRPDLDVINALNKAKIILNDGYKIKTNDKIFLNGYSTSGVFAQRFSLIHPELVDAVCIGGASGTIPIPNSNLDYPLGTRNFEELFGKKFDTENYKNILFNYYVSGLECKKKSKNILDENGNPASQHDMSYNERSVPKEERRITKKNAR